MHTYTHNPYEISAPTTPRDEASSSNQQLVNAQKTPDRPANMRRVTTKTRVKLNEKLLSPAQEAAFVASQEVLKKQAIKREADRILLQITEEEKRALIIAEAMQQTIQIEKQAKKLAVAAREANALTLKMQDHMEKNPKNINKVLRELRNAYTKSADINLVPTPPRSVFLSEEYLRQPSVGAPQEKNHYFSSTNNKSVILSKKQSSNSKFMHNNPENELQNRNKQQKPQAPFWWTKQFMQEHPTVSVRTLEILQDHNKKTSTLYSNNI